MPLRRNHCTAVLVNRWLLIEHKPRRSGVGDRLSRYDGEHRTLAQVLVVLRDCEIFEPVRLQIYPNSNRDCEQDMRFVDSRDCV